MNNDSQNNIEKKYKRKDSLIRMKYFEYIPVLYIMNLSTLLLMAVDGLVVGNLMGPDALAAVNVFAPISVLLSAYIAIIVNGIADGYSGTLVENNREKINHSKKAVLVVVVVSALVLSLIQIPIAHLIIHSYELDGALYALARTYASAMLISMPFRLVSDVGAGLLKEFGRMKVLLVLAILEAMINLVLDIIFVRYFNLGLYGTGVATVVACATRAIITIIYFKTKTDMLDLEQARVKWQYVKEIVVGGFPYTVGVLSSALHSYLMLKLVIYLFGSDGGVIMGVCNLCTSLATVFIVSCADSNGPLMGIFLSIGDRIAMRDAMKIAVRQILVCVGFLVLIVELNPEWFYYIHGVKEIPEYGVIALRFNALFYIFLGCNTLFEAYFIDRKHARISMRHTFYGDMIIPVLAFLLYKMFGKPYLWLSDFIVESTILLLYLRHYFIIVVKEELNEIKNSDILYLEVEPDEAANASKSLDQYAEDNNYSKVLSNHLALCMEEMVEYAKKSQNRLEIHIQIVINFFKNGARFVMLDDGKRLNFDKVKDRSEIVTNNYELVKKLSKSYEYQYILNMNHTTLEF
ncbi:MAG: MATE family efflux transporter [Lachnospiraceae bacterium]|nr:MATE family efflux transporter [Lachnospiraceae bacterium]